MISIIVAVAGNWAIGKNNALLWHLSEDLKYFKRITSGHAVIMGYNTFLSIGGRPLPNRRNIVVDNTRPTTLCDGYESYNSLGEALAAVASEEEAFICGGAMLYRTALPFVDKLYITHVHKRVPDADTFFPEISADEWEADWESERFLDEKENISFTFTTYRRK